MPPQQLTVADVLSHRVGLRHNAFDRDLEANVDYYTLTQKLAYAPMACAPGTCYGYQNIAFSLIGDVIQAAAGDSYGQAVQRRIFRPLGMTDASVGLEGIVASQNWARPHVRTRGGWLPLFPKATYYHVAPAAGVNASASDMAQWLLAQTGHRPDVLSAPLLATLHQPLVTTPTELRGSSWRRERLNSAGYALGWRVYDYAGHNLIFHGGAVQGYRGVVALLPERDLGIALMWNSDSSRAHRPAADHARSRHRPERSRVAGHRVRRPLAVRRRRHTGHAESEPERRRHDDHQSHGLAAVIIWKPADQAERPDPSGVLARLRNEIQRCDELMQLTSAGRASGRRESRAPDARRQAAAHFEHSQANTCIHAVAAVRSTIAPAA